MKANPPLAWHPEPVSAPVDLNWWLTHRGSLTRLIQDRCEHFQVEPVFQALSTACIDELEIMHLRRQTRALIREVYLRCNETPVVFAHSIVRREHLRGAWRGLSRLGNQSLGTMLFTNPLIQRTPLAFRKLKPHHPLFERACRQLQIRPINLWARRSLFILLQQPILVTEVFLPAIRRL
ncbi:chorismate lyase [Nitrosomonas sp. HPC101]|uniref:chorismate--pyruvate lyase family protein n=1 Tax=Nitrosomonas sp. HPC101 TaxID=1658667 RepID=UPI001371BC4D|nr:chorismate lyase [Nitrosomonas sp. HPC101]MXS85331.1 chorismate lyase [Nitrosomonas sp. HPC101]